MQNEDKRKYFLLSIDSQNDTLLSKFDHLSELKVFRAILRECNEKLIWVHNKHTRTVICNSIMTKYDDSREIVKTKYLSEISFKKHLNSLVKKELLTKLSRGMYQLNKKYIN